MTLAEKNKNPLNLRPLLTGEAWVGQTDVDENPVSGSFCVFSSNAFGVRAAVKNMMTYVRMGTDTIEEIIYRWAPPNVAAEVAAEVAQGVGNHTEAYIQRVCGSAGVDRHYSLRWIGSASPADDDLPVLAKIIMAMNRVEAGALTVTEADVMTGIKYALGLPT